MKGGVDDMATKRERIPMVSSLTMAFKKATTVTEDVEEAKREHRSNLNLLVTDYMAKVSRGEAEGIRNAKELVEVIKADMLLMGEATDRTETSNNVDEIRLREVSSILDESEIDIEGLMEDLFAKMNGINDKHGDQSNIRHEKEDDWDSELIPEADPVEKEGWTTE